MQVSALIIQLRQSVERIASGIHSHKFGLQVSVFAYAGFEVGMKSWLWVLASHVCDNRAAANISGSLLL